MVAESVSGGVTAAAVKTRAKELGFDLCGVAPAVPFERLGVLREWLDRGYAGEMHYLARNAERRADPRAVLPGARAVVVLGTIYNVDRPYSTEIDDPAVALISRYAWGDDYHDVVGARTESLAEWMAAAHPGGCHCRPYVDTGPVQEKAFAERAGLGWVGKNTCLIHPELGSWLFLSVVITTLSLLPDPPGFDQCGSCTLCLDACPTGAFPAPGMLDSTRCLSYVTIETKDVMSDTMRDALGNHVYGCDICQEVCPYNQQPPVSADPAWQPREALDRPALLELWRRSDDQLRTTIRGSAMTRARLRRLRRNVAVALGNSEAPEAARTLAQPEAGVAKPADSVSDPLVEEHLTWARARLDKRLR